MGATIKALTTAGYGSGFSYLKSGTEAVGKCIEQLPQESGRLGLLINVGVYPDGYIQEPAFASLIQGELSNVFETSLEGTFSFDIHSGGGGLVIALSILSGFIESGKIEHGVVVAGDSMPYRSQAGALLLGKGAKNEGFQGFRQDTYPRFITEFESYSSCRGNKLETFINQQETYCEHCIQCARESLNTFLRESALCAGEIDLCIPSQSPAGFAPGLMDYFGRGRVLMLTGEVDCYSAGSILAMAQSKLRFQKTPGKVLFISVGPGITVDLALYVNPEQE